MKTPIKFLFFIFFAILFSFYVVNALPNSAAIYCKDLGYGYRIDKTEKGEKGVCILPDKNECEEWQFFKGKCGQEYSYCAKNWSDIETITSEKEPYHEYAICVDKITKQKIGSVTDLMNFKERLMKYGLMSYSKNLTAPKIRIPPCYDLDGLDYYVKGYVEFDSTIYTDNCVNDEVLIEGYCKDGYFKTTTYYCPEGCLEGACLSKSPAVIKKLEMSTTSHPSSWDWSHQILPSAEPLGGEDWTTPAKDQGTCGSCYAFAPIGTQEAKIDIVFNNPDYDVDLSEQDIVSCAGAGDCNSGLEDTALGFIRDTGVVDEDCFPYTSGTGTIEPCSNKYSNCPDWSERLWKIDSFTDITDETSDYIKEKLRVEGPIVTRMWIDSEIDPGEYVYTCATPGNPNHAVVIVGYSDTGNYWIAKNSYGTGYGVNGYFKIGYGQCNVNPRFWIEMIPDSCEDSDGGYDPLTGGTVSGYQRGFPYSSTDRCNPHTGKLIEYFCDGGQSSQSPPITCSEEYGPDYICTEEEMLGIQGGRCRDLNAPDPSCTDYDHGIQPLTGASVYGYDYYGEYYRHYDTCIDGMGNEVTTSDRYLKERNCTDAKPEDTIIDCKDYGSKYYCSYGKCYSGMSGCPILKLWNGEEFVAIEKLDIHAPEGVDTTILKEVSMKPIEDGKYKIILKEAPYLSLNDDGSNIDYVMLTTRDGKECELISAVHNKKGDILSAIKDSDDVRVRTEADEEIVLVYECYGNDFIFSIEGYNPIHPYLKLASGYIKTLIDAVKGILSINY